MEQARLKDRGNFHFPDMNKIKYKVNLPFYDLDRVPQTLFLRKPFSIRLTA